MIQELSGSSLTVCVRTNALSAATGALIEGFQFTSSVASKRQTVRILPEVLEPCAHACHCGLSSSA